jgi:peptide/nickel transport system substrate-binding protein
MNSQSTSLSTWATNPLWQVVDGPWHLEPKTGFETDGLTIMIPNKSYSGPDKPKIAKFEELPFTSSAAEFNERESGAIDYGYVPNTDVKVIPSLRSSGYQIKPWYEWGITFIGINFPNPKYGPIVAQTYIRQAMQELIDQPRYIKSLLAGYGTPTYGPVPTFPKTDFLSPQEYQNPDPFDPAAAKALLVRHGWSIPAKGSATCVHSGNTVNECGAGIAAGTPLALTIQYVSGVPAVDDEVIAMESEFATVGIALQLKPLPESSVLTNAYACAGLTSSRCPASSPVLTLISSPVYTYVPIYYPDGGSLFSCGGATNGGNYCNHTVDDYINTIRTGLGSSALSALHAYQVYLARQVPVLWFPNSAYQISAISPKLRGVVAQDSTGHIYPSTWYVES